MFQDSAPPPDGLTAIILAAGNGSRIQNGSVPQPKPLIKLGGLCLAERAVLTLKQAGVKKFRIVTGAFADQVETKLKSLKSLKGLDVTYVRCETYEKGNGESLGAGVEGVPGAFLVVMADHVFSPNGVVQFLKDIAVRGLDAPYLATDGQIDAIFDIDDATKVQAGDGKIQSIGKEVSVYNEIDTGLFFFPVGASDFIHGVRAAGATSVSEVVNTYVREKEFRTQQLLPAAFWQDVDTPAMAREAERKMMYSLRKPTDGFISRHLNRKVSGPISRVLANLGVSPSTVTTFVFLISLFAAYLATTGDYWYLAIAGLIFQFASIVDGCDGEIARMAYKHTNWGAWYDTLTDNVRYGVFFASMGIGIWRTGGSVAYVWGAVFFLFMLFFHVSLMIKFELKTRSGTGTHLVVTAHVAQKAKEKASWWDRNIIALRGLVKQDVSALFAMFFCLFGWQKPLFYAGAFALVMMLVSVLRILPAPEQTKYPKLHWLKDFAPFAYFSVGFALLIYLLNYAPKTEILEALNRVGFGAWVAFGLAILWLATNAWSLLVLAQRKFKWAEAISTLIITEALNSVVPLAGVAGEPYKAKYLATQMTWSEAWSVVLKDRLLHGIAGLFFTGGLALLTPRFVQVDATYERLLYSIGAFMFIAGFVCYGVGTSKRLNHIVKRLIGKFQFLDRVEILENNRALVLSALAWKLVGRALGLLEIAAYLYLLRMPMDLGTVLLVSTFISASGLLFFMIPQGIGVAEGSLIAAFHLLNIAPTDALAFGLLRRARILIWSFIGITWLAIISVVNHLRSGARAQAKIF